MARGLGQGALRLPHLWRLLLVPLQCAADAPRAGETHEKPYEESDPGDPHAHIGPSAPRPESDGRHKDVALSLSFPFLSSTTPTTTPRARNAATACACQQKRTRLTRSPMPATQTQGPVLEPFAVTYPVLSPILYSYLSLTVT